MGQAKAVPANQQAQEREQSRNQANQENHGSDRWWLIASMLSSNVGCKHPFVSCILVVYLVSDEP